jgi:hypothetical protein
MEQHMMVNPSAHLVSIEETEEHLRLHWRFTALMPTEQACQRLQEYFAQLGYTPVASENNTLTMQRGSEAWALDWSPRSKEAELIAHFTPSGNRTSVTMELRFRGDWLYEAETRLYAWELVEAEQYLYDEPVNFTAMKQLNHQMRMQALRAFARGFTIGVFLATVVGIALFFALTGLGVEGWLRKTLVGAAMHMIILWQIVRATVSTFGSRKR